MENQNAQVFVFWSYDLFPYTCGAPAELLPNGGFRPEGYGGATWGRESIIAIYPIELGKEIKAKLNLEKDKHREAIDKVFKDGLDSVDKILPELRQYRKARRQTPN